ncbi:MAG: HAMP domain-containing sensor histidine kinase [Acidobacteriota bacterium]
MKHESLKDANVRRVQIVFLFIFGISAAQVVWWIIDQSLYAQRVHDRWQALYEADIVAAIAMLNRGAREESIEDLFPHLDVDFETGVALSPVALEKLEEERRAHISQYAWEGLFFLAVILAGMAVILRAVRREAQLRRWQTNFLSAVSHELKSPLASLQLAAETLEFRQADSHHRRRLVLRMLADVRRLNTTVTNVLDTDRLDRGALNSQSVQLVLADAVADAVAEQELRIDARDVEIEIDVGTEAMILADPVGVQTVLRNLLDNALKATEVGGRIILGARSDAHRVQLEIQDDGVGFPSGEAERLFEKFFRVGDELRRTQPGSGLGLYLARHLVELDGGSLTASSDGVGHGARFLATWRRASVPSTEAAA